MTKKKTNLGKRVHMLAYVEVLVELDGVNMEKSVKEFYEMNKKDYLQQAKENQQKMN